VRLLQDRRSGGAQAHLRADQIDRQIGSEMRSRP
jgi:hypothetical protein